MPGPKLPQIVGAAEAMEAQEVEVPETPGVAVEALVVEAPVAAVLGRRAAAAPAHPGAVLAHRAVAARARPEVAVLVELTVALVVAAMRVEALRAVAKLLPQLRLAKRAAVLLKHLPVPRAAVIRVAKQPRAAVAQQVLMLPTGKALAALGQEATVLLLLVQAVTLKSLPVTNQWKARRIAPPQPGKLTPRGKNHALSPPRVLA